MSQINNAAERNLVNYRTDEEINGPWYSLNNLTSANFIFDTVIKNMGFTIGAAFSGGVYSKAISWGAKALSLSRLGQASAATIEAGQKAMEAANATRATKALVGSFFNAHAEAVQEAYNAS
nr:MAG TPA: Structural protein [Bacteriophage sp.]